MPFCFISSMISCNRREKSVQKEWMFVGTEVSLLPACTIHWIQISIPRRWAPERAGELLDTDHQPQELLHLWLCEWWSWWPAPSALWLWPSPRRYALSLSCFLTQPLNATLSHLSETDLRTLDAGQWRQKHHCVWISCWFTDF